MITTDVTSLNLPAGCPHSQEVSEQPASGRPGAEAVGLALRLALLKAMHLPPGGLLSDYPTSMRLSELTRDLSSKAHPPDFWEQLY